jgi:putative ABC transport system substrate-binding protein
MAGSKALGPDVILASGDHSVVALQRATRTLPIVFALVSDPVGTGYVESLARPGANATGLSLQSLDLAGNFFRSRLGHDAPHPPEPQNTVEHRPSF